MLYLLLFILALGLVCLLGKHCMPPLMAGALGVTLGAQTNDIRWAILMGASLYITCFMSNTIPQSVGYSTDAEMLGVLSELNEENAGRLYVYRGAALLLFFILPIPSAPAQIPWQLSLPVGLLLLITASNRVSWLDTLAYTIVQGLSIWLCCWISTELGWVINPVTGVICALAIPKLLFTTKRTRIEESSNQLFFFPASAAVLGLLAVWLTPGFSVSAVSNTMFRRGVSRSIMQGFLEGAVEGYVLSLMTRGVISGKSTWGDLLQTNVLNWGSFTPSYTVMSILMFSICIGLVLPIVFVHFSKPITRNECKHFKYYTTIFLVGQAVIDVNYLLPMFILVGLLLYKLREWLELDEEVSSLGMLSMMM